MMDLGGKRGIYNNQSFHNSIWILLTFNEPLISTLVAKKKLFND